MCKTKTKTRNKSQWMPVKLLTKGQKFLLPPTIRKQTAWGDHPWEIENPTPHYRPGWVEISPCPLGPGDAVYIEFRYFLRGDIKVRIANGD